MSRAAVVRRLRRVTKVSVLGIGALAVTVVPLLLAGCGRVRPGRQPPVAPGGVRQPGASTLVTCGPAGVQLVSVSVGGCGRVLAVAVQVPAGRDGCMRTLTAGLGIRRDGGVNRATRLSPGGWRAAGSPAP